MNVRSFQIYLLASMRSREQVDRALTALGATRTDLLVATGEAELAGFEATGHPATLYRAVLGPPTTVAPNPSPGLSDEFANSTFLHFRLPLWPEFDFVVREAPAGFAWGPRFVRAAGVDAPVLDTAADLAPWRFVAPEVARSFGTPKSEDAWNNWEDFSYAIAPRPAQAPRRYLLGFDFDLLQTIIKLE